MWYNFDTGTPGIVFIKLNEAFHQHVDVRLLSKFILNQIKKGEYASKFTCRMVPTSVLCKASGNIAEFQRLIRPVITEVLTELMEQGASGFSFCVEYKNKNNAKIKRQEYLDAIREIMDQVNLELVADEPDDDAKNAKKLAMWIDYRNAHYDFLLEVYRDIMAFAVCPGYKSDWNKYNL